MSSETYSYKGIAAGKYVEGQIEAINKDEASFKLKEQKIIITTLLINKTSLIRKRKLEKRQLIRNPNKKKVQNQMV